MRRVNKANGATIDFLWAYDALRNRKRLNELQGPWPRNFVYDAFGRLAHIGIPFGPYTDLYQDGPDTALMHSGVRSDQPTWTRFVHGPGDDQVLAMEVYAPNADPTPGTGQQFYFHADGEGSIRLVTDATGNVANRYDYDSFGRRIAVTESVQQPYGWKGRDFIAGPDVYYNRARFYDPVLGKFIAEDPLGFEGGDTNLYNFGWNNPRNWKDPSGLSAELGLQIRAGILAVQGTGLAGAGVAAIGSAAGGAAGEYVGSLGGVMSAQSRIALTGLNLACLFNTMADVVAVMDQGASVAINSWGCTATARAAPVLSSSSPAPAPGNGGGCDDLTGAGKFYVYLVHLTGGTYYVGKGKNRRWKVSKKEKEGTGEVECWEVGDDEDEAYRRERKLLEFLGGPKGKWAPWNKMWPPQR